MPFCVLPTVFWITIAELPLGAIPKEDPPGAFPSTKLTEPTKKLLGNGIGSEIVVYCPPVVVFCPH